MPIPSLVQLERAELVRRAPESVTGLDEVAYWFKHALVQDTAYSSLLKNERRRLHRLIGETLEREYPAAVQENAALLTKHFAEAGDDVKTLEYAGCAGDAEARVYAKTEAAAHYQAALDAALRLNAQAPQLIELVTKLGRVHELRDDYAAALALYARLGTLAEARNDQHLELAGLILQATLYATPTAVFDPRKGREILDRALALARELQDGAAEARILWNLLLLCGFTGQYAAAVAYGEASLALARKLDLKTQIAYTLNDIGNYGYFGSKEHDKSRAALKEARALWRELEILPMLADNLNNSGILEYVRGDYEQAVVYSDEALEVSERIDSMWGQGLARTFRGVLKLEAGEYGLGIAELESAYELAERSGSAILFLTATYLGLAYSWVGDIEAGFRAVQIINREIEIALYRPPAKATLAYLTFLHGGTAEGERLLREARPHPHEELQFSYLPGIIAEGELGLAAGREDYVAEFMESLAENLRTFGLVSFVGDADLYRGRALTLLGRLDEARAAFARAETYALRLASRRALWQIYLYWSRLEFAAQDTERAQSLHAQASDLIGFIAAGLPERRRASFLELTQEAG
jgi:hypothetical protein